MYIGEIGTLTADELRFMMIYKTEPYEKLQQLLNHGVHNVAIVEMGKKFAPDINPGSRWSIIARTKQLGTKMLKETKVIEITKEGVVVENEEGRQTLPADTVVIAAGAKPNNDMYEQLVGKVKNVDCIYTGKTMSMVIGAVSPATWNALCDCMGHPEYKEDPRFVTMPDRCKHHTLVEQIITDWINTF